MKTIKTFTKKQKVLIGVEIAVLVLIIIYAGMGFFFNSHFAFRTTVNGVNASGKSIKQVEQLIKQEIDGYELVLEERGGKTEVLKGTVISLQPEFDGSLKKELKKQNGFAWIVSLFHSSEIEVDTMVKYDESALKKELNSLNCMDESQMVRAESARISEYSKKNGYKILPEKNGTVLNDKNFLKAVDGAVTNLKERISLDKEGCYKEPEYTKDSKEMKNLADTMNRYVKTEITYEFGNSTEKLGGDEISRWIEINSDMEAELSAEKAAEYVAMLGERYNTAGKSKSLKTSYGSTITVSGGDYGWKIDREKETAELLEQIKEGKQVSKEPVYAKRASSREGNDYGNTYVEVNLTAQHMYYYKNGSLVLETDFVSGNEAKGWNTPVGVYGLYYKQRDKTLRGEDYATPVSFWMPFNGGVGFHDATWRRDFGGNYYKKGGSHGCVNMPYSAAKKLYENIESGCPIFVYTLPGTESAKAKAQDAAAAVVSAIGSIGEVSLNSKDIINSIRGQYNALDDTARGYVTNYDVLAAAEARLAELEAQAAAAQADAQAQKEAQAVIDEINNKLAGQEITLEKKSVVEKIRKKYNALSDAAKAKVTNYDVLTEAEKIIKSLKK